MLLQSLDERRLDLQTLSGATPFGAYSRTEREFWSECNSLVENIDAMRWLEESSKSGLRELRSNIDSFLSRTDRHIETCTRIIRIVELSRGRKKSAFDDVFRPFRNPISRATGSLKHAAASVELLHYSHMKHGVVGGFFIQREIDLNRVGPDPNVHPNNSAWSFNRTIPAIVCGIAFCKLTLERVLRGNISHQAQMVESPTMTKALSSFEKYTRSYFEDEVKLPVPIIRRKRESCEFVVSSYHGIRATYPDEAVRFKTYSQDVRAGMIIEFPYFGVQRA